MKNWQETKPLDASRSSFSLRPFTSSSPLLFHATKLKAGPLSHRTQHHHHQMSSFFGATASAPSSRSSNPFSFASLSSTSKRRSYPLPTRAPFNRTNSGSSDHREGSIRIKLLNILSKPVTGWIALLAVLSLVVCWGIGVGSGVSGRERGSGGRRVIARDWRNLPELQLDKRGGIKPDQTILVRPLSVSPNSRPPPRRGACAFNLLADTSYAIARRRSYVQ